MDFCTNCVNEYAWRPTNNPFPKECKECEVIDGKPSKFKPKNKTNAEWMRNMSDKELVEFIGHNSLCDRVQGEAGNWCNDHNCTDCLQKWLKQPAE